jgi:AbrB family looped-hinge helix DNA binding protein
MTAFRPDWTAIVTSRGRVTIPKPVRTFLGIEPGATICFEPTGDGEIALRVARSELAPAKPLCAAPRLRDRQDAYGRNPGPDARNLTSSSPGAAPTTPAPCR